MQVIHQNESEPDGLAKEFMEDWKSSFSIIEDEKSVHRKARVHNSVVLDGARIEAGAIVVRSVVCPGGCVKAADRMSLIRSSRPGVVTSVHNLHR